MNDILVGLGLLLVAEGLIWALSPRSAVRLLEVAARTPEQVLRTAGTVTVAAGCGIVWLVRG